MSTQETNLAAIASAIRQKDGSTGPIRALDFAVRILAIPTVGGGGSDFAVPLKVTADPGALITAVNGGKSVTAAVGDSGEVTMTLTAPGTWTVTGELDGKEQSVQVVVKSGYEAAFNLVSRLPEGYTELEYIESSGSQYIYTGVVPTAAMKVYMDFNILSLVTGAAFFGCYSKAGTRYVQFRVFYNGTTKTFRAMYGGNSSANPATVDFTAAVGRHTVELNALEKSCTFDGKKEALAVSYTPEFSAMLLLFANNSAGTYNSKSSMRLYSCQIWDNGAPIRDYIPCKDPSGKVGLYDAVAQAFNAGNGTFAAGPAI